MLILHIKVIQRNSYIAYILQAVDIQFKWIHKKQFVSRQSYTSVSSLHETDSQDPYHRLTELI